VVATPLGLRRGEVVVVPYDPRWPILFEEASAQLRAALGPSTLGVHHVGSTAVPGGELRTHHLSLAEPGSRHHRVTLAFRDALRDDPELAAAYARLKLALAQRFPFDRPAYIDGKSAFVRRVLATLGLNE